MKLYSQSPSGIGCGCVVAIILVLLVSLWTNSNLDFWLTYFKGHEIHIPYWLSVLLTVALNGVIFVANVIASIARYFI